MRASKQNKALLYNKWRNREVLTSLCDDLTYKSINTHWADGQIQMRKVSPRNWGLDNPGLRFKGRVHYSEAIVSDHGSPVNYVAGV